MSLKPPIQIIDVFGDEGTPEGTLRVSTETFEAEADSGPYIVRVLPNVGGTWLIGASRIVLLSPGERSGLHVPKETCEVLLDIYDSQGEFLQRTSVKDPRSLRGKLGQLENLA